jgi:putative phosphoesterase
MSKKILALSDIHGNIPAIAAVLKWAAGELENSDMAVFLGDGLRELSFAQRQAILPCEWKKVRGNNDGASPGDAMPTAPESEVFDFGGHRFYLCHGHRHALYNGFDKLAASALKAGADAALFGHIHVPCLETVNGLLLVCPGGISRARSSAGETFAVIECMPEKPLKVHFWGIESNCNIRELILK